MDIAKRLHRSIYRSKSKGSGSQASESQFSVDELLGENEFDERYSRQTPTYGAEAMAKLMKMKILVIGLNGVGIEVAKNLVLVGPGVVTIYDNEVVQMRDLGSNFYLREEDVGKRTRAEASLNPLKKLNSLVKVSILKGALSKSMVSQYTVVVDCGLSNAEALKWNAFCRKTLIAGTKQSIGYIRSINYGLTGFVFSDLGDKVTVRDLSGEAPVTRIIHKIDNIVLGRKPELHVHLLPPPEGKRHNIDESKHEGWVTFEEVPGALGLVLNGKGPFELKHATRTNSMGEEVYDPYSFKIRVPGRSTLPLASGPGGRMIQVKRPVEMRFRSLADNLVQPFEEHESMLRSLLLFTDGAKMGRVEQLHVALHGLWEYERKHGSLPKPNDNAAAAKVVQMAVALNESKKKIPDAFTIPYVDKDVVELVAKYAGCTFQPMSCFFGGVVAQEVVKMTGKFTPIHQWVAIDCFEVLPEELVNTEHEDYVEVRPQDRKPIGSRYDDLIQILGIQLHKKLLKSKAFMVGCGALGCELLKNYALLGVGCDESGAGLLTVTDNDSIEISNLSRQFLFSQDNIGQSKSIAAKSAVQAMNPAMNVRAREDLVEAETERIFDEQFWESLDFVTNALDNVKARVYVDSKCVFHEKPLLESGTLGTKCSTQTIIPHLTASYSDGPVDAQEEGIPSCTLRNFPSEIEHCIEWARSQFDDLFTLNATKAQQFLDNPKQWLIELRENTLDSSRSNIATAVAQEMESLKAVHKFLMEGNSGKTSFKDCVRMAYELFHQKYRDAIDSLIELYPEDSLDRDGNPYWSGTKRFPRSVVNFDINNETHIQYVVSMANILAVNFGLRPSHEPVPVDHEWRSEAYVGEIIASLGVPESTQVRVDMSGGGELDDTTVVTEDTLAAQIEEFEFLLYDLVELAKDEKAMMKIRVEPAEFEKDDNLNFHVDFVTAASNIRAWNYRLKQVSKQKCRLIAGKIIPAIATTTAAVTGLVCIELLKLIQPGKLIEAFKDSSNSLGTNNYFFSEPPAPVKAMDSFDIIELREVMHRPPGYTKWDKTVITGDLTLREFLDQYKIQTGLNCVSLAHPSSSVGGVRGTIYESDISSKAERVVYEERMDIKLKTLVTEIYGLEALPMGTTQIPLDCASRDDDNDAYNIPQLVYRLK